MYTFGDIGLYAETAKDVELLVNYALGKKVHCVVDLDLLTVTVDGGFSYDLKQVEKIKSNYIILESGDEITDEERDKVCGEILENLKEYVVIQRTKDIIGRRVIFDVLGGITTKELRAKVSAILEPRGWDTSKRPFSINLDEKED